MSTSIQSLLDISEMGKVVTPLVGTFVGAWLAFLSNRYFQKKAERDKNITAAHLALLMIRARLDDWLNYRRAFLVAMVEALKHYPAPPEWVFAKPILYKFSPGAVFNFESLAFLLATKSGERAFSHLQHMERRYHDLSTAHEAFNESTQELQKAAVEVHKRVANPDSITLEMMETAIGPELIARVQDQQRSVLLRVELDETDYHDAFNHLNAEIVSMFGAEAGISALAIPQAFRRESLPKLPKSLAKFIDTFKSSRPSMVVGNDSSLK